MRTDIELRVLSIAKAMVLSGATVRALAREYGVSKSTVHKDMAQRLKKLDADLYDKVALVLRTNKAERHLRGGHATSLKYKLWRESRARRQTAGARGALYAFDRSTRGRKQGALSDKSKSANPDPSPRAP